MTRTGTAVYQNLQGQQRETFASDKGHMLVDLDAVPKRFDVFEVIPHNLTSAGNGAVAEETLLDIEHGLDYVPRVIVFFYVPTAEFVPGAFFQPTGAYVADVYNWNTGAGPQDMLYPTVDATHFKILHRYVEPSSTPSTSASNLRTFNIKYLIASLRGPIVRLPNS